jgi:hypothetical protein
LQTVLRQAEQVRAVRLRAPDNVRVLHAALDLRIEERALRRRLEHL